MKKQKRGPLRWLLRFVWRIVLSVVVLAVLIFGGCWWYFTRVQPMAPAMAASVASSIATHHVRPLAYSEIPVFYRQAVIATEDRRFATDPGVDLIGIARSIFVDIQKDGYIEGGSTITQQLVDNTLLGQRKTIQRKLLQALYAIGVYDTMQKSQVFADYANVIYFGQGAYGLYNASMTYFGRTPGQLNQGELAVLAGLPNAPNAYEPFSHLTLAKERQRIVLKNMVDAGYLSQGQAKHIEGLPIRLRR